MSRRKTLEEEADAHAANPANWLEPFQNWVLAAKNAGEIAFSGSLPEKKGLALKIFGSNLVLDCKKARGSALKPWSFIPENRKTGGMVGWLGLEPRTNGLKGRCSTD